MKSVSTRKINVKLTLDGEEAQWLHDQLQNPPEKELPRHSKIRSTLLSILHKALKG